MDISQIITQMVVLFLMMGTGYRCGKLNIIDSDFSKKLTNLILTITTPAMIIASVAGDIGIEKSVAIQIIGISLLIFAIFIPRGFLVAKLLRVPKEDFKLYLFMAVFSNTGFMGYPVVRTIFGDYAVFLTSIYNMVQAVFLYSFGIWLMDNSGDGKFNIKNIINPNMIASILALIIFLCDIPMPTVIAKTCDSIGSITSPAAMLLIGAGLSVMPVKEIFTEFRLYPFAAVKQIILPFAMFMLFGLFVKDATLLGIVTVIAAMPVASVSVMFANQYGGNANMASKGVFITTMCSFVTIPILCMFLAKRF